PALRLTFDFGALSVSYSFRTMDAVADVFRVAGVSSLLALAGQHVRIQYMSQASWNPFFRVWHIVDAESLLVAYDEAGLGRYARGERV
ncbi:hypothetical protein LCGC14_2953070, partial [marine sediment metagenome]